MQQHGVQLGEKNVVWKGDFEIDLVKQDSLTIMRHHANQQIKKLQDHATLLVDQAQEIMDRVRLAEMILTAEYGFKPIPLKEYYLYEKGDKLVLTLISPDEWDSPYGECIAKVRQLGDSTWEQVTSQVKETQQEKQKSLEKRQKYSDQGLKNMIRVICTLQFRPQNIELKNQKKNTKKPLTKDICRAMNDPTKPTWMIKYCGS